MSNNLVKLPQIRGQYRFNSKIKNWFDVGGPAEIIFRPADFADLEFFLKNLSPEIPLNIIGAASNVIIDDAGIAGVVIKLGAEFAEISHEKIINKSSEQENLIATKAKPEFLIKAGGATPCANLAAYCQIHGIGGLEFLATIPGSIGGAIAMNAGCYGGEIADWLFEVQSLDFKGNSQVLTKADCQFSYRHNHLAKNFIFTAGVFFGIPSTPEAVATKIAEFKNNRELSQPIRAKTGGSTFKNPQNLDFSQVRIDQLPKNLLESKQIKAWELIDAIGFRGKKIGGAKFSEKHCNFLINESNAKASDLLALGEEARKKVRKKFGIELEWEIKHLC